MSPLSKLRLTRTAWVLAVAGAITGWSALYLIENNNPNGIVILDQLGPGYRAYWVLALAACLCLMASIPLRRQILGARQQLNELAARQMLEELQTSTEIRDRRFFVYLRSFETTGHLKPPFFFTLFVLQRLHTNELESFLALALAKDGPLVGLGLPGENVGAARIRVEDSEWKQDIQRLLTHATGVLLLPSAHEGALSGRLNFCKGRGCLTRPSSLCRRERISSTGAQNGKKQPTHCGSYRLHSRSITSEGCCSR